jgi:C1A family cysteine protease
MKAINRPVGGFKVHSWRRQLPDHRDHPFTALVYAPPAEMPSIATGARIHDQGQTNSCTGHGPTTALEVALGLKGDAGQLSRMMAYYDARDYIGETKLDDGAYIRDVFRGFLAKGVAPERNWAFNDSNLLKAPTKTALAHAMAMRQKVLDAGIVYESLKTLDEIKTAIAQGQCVTFGFTVYESIFRLDNHNFVLPFPGPTDKPVGGHCVVADGYSDRLGHVFCQNSWGAHWGNHGYFNMPYQWFTDPNYLTGDFWTCRKSR